MLDIFSYDREKKRGSFLYTIICRGNVYIKEEGLGSLTIPG